MELKEGVWVVGFPYVTAIATALRDGLIRVAQMKSIDANRAHAETLVFDYITSNGFVQHMRAIIDKRRAAPGRPQLGAALDGEDLEEASAAHRGARPQHTAGIYGDLEGLVGPSLPTIEKLELPAPVVPIRSAS